MRPRSIRLLLLLVLVSACTRVTTGSPTSPDRTPTSPTPTPTTADRIEFRVVGSQLLTPVTIRHIDPENGLTIVTSTPPYVATATNTDPSAFVYVDASGFGVSISTLQVQIFVNGRVFREGSSVGSVLMAQASGTWHR